MKKADRRERRSALGSEERLDSMDLVDYSIDESRSVRCPHARDIVPSIGHKQR